MNIATPKLSETHRNLFDRLCERPRRPGSTHASAMQEWIKECFAERGLTAYLQKNSFTGWDNKVKPHIRFISPDSLDCEYYAVIWSPSIDGIAKGKLEKAGQILTFEQYPWDRYAVKNEKGKILFYLISEKQIYSPVQTLDDDTEKIPYFTIDAHKDIEKWLAEEKEIIVEASMENVFYPDTPLVNVIGEKEGPISTLITCHLDSIYNGVGAHDNASGTIALLDLAKKDLPQGARLVAFDGEEMNKIGAYKYAAHLDKTNNLSQVKLQINFDSIAVGEFVYVLTSPQIYDHVKTLLADIPIEVVTREAFKQFDTWPFMQRGIPVIQIGSTSKDNIFRYFNSPNDTVGGNGYELDSALISQAVEIGHQIAHDFQANPERYPKA